MPAELTFETAWRLWINGPSDFHRLDEQQAALRRCLRAASTIDELMQVCTAASQTQGIEGICSPALRKMIDLIGTKEEAQRVYIIAGRRSQQGFMYRTLQPLVKEKLDSFT